MKKVISFIKENVFLSISTLLLILVIMLILIAYIPNWNIKTNDKINNTSESGVKNKADNQEETGINLSENGEFANYNKEKSFVCNALNEEIYLADPKSFISYDGSKYSYYLYNITKKYENEQNCLQVFKTDKKIIGYKDYWLHDGFGDIGVVYSDLTYDIVYNRQLVTIGKYVAHEKDVERIKRNYNYIYYYRLEDLIGGNVSSSLIVGKQAIYDGIFSEEHYVVDVFEGSDIKKVFPRNVINGESVFTYGVINKDCYEYVDRKCEYGFVVNDDLERYKDLIAFMNESYIVFKDGTTYSYQHK